jgi:hypothetical protein
VKCWRKQRAFFVERNLPKHRIRSLRERDHIPHDPIGRDSAVGIAGQDETCKLAALLEPCIGQIHRRSTSTAGVPAITRQRRFDDAEFERQMLEGAPRQIRATVATIVSEDQDPKSARIYGKTCCVGLSTKGVDARRQSKRFVLHRYRDDAWRKAHFVLAVFCGQNPEGPAALQV